MAKLEMQGPYKLDAETVNKIVTKISAGNYALGKKDDEDVFKVGYVGRSDSDVNDRLLHWAEKSSRPLFKFSYASSVKEAFEKECKNYHDFDPPDNDIHPDRPKDKDWECPICTIFDD